MTTIGDRIREVLDSIGKSQKALAEEIGTHPQTVSSWVTDEKTPRGSSLYKLANALDVSVTWLRTGEGRKDLALPPPPGGWGGGVVAVLPPPTQQMWSADFDPAKIKERAEQAGLSLSEKELLDPQLLYKAALRGGIGPNWLAYGSQKAQSREADEAEFFHRLHRFLGIRKNPTADIDKRTQEEVEESPIATPDPGESSIVFRPLTPAQGIAASTILQDIRKMTDIELLEWFKRYQSSKTE